MNLIGKVIGVAGLVLMLASCSSMKLPTMPSMPSFSSGKPKGSPVYEVMVQGAPFYLDRSPEGIGGSAAHPYLYLPKGTTVNLQKVGKRYSKVSLVNGMQGWMPGTALAPKMTMEQDVPPGASSAAPHALPPSAVQDSPDASRLNPDANLQLPSYQ